MPGWPRGRLARPETEFLTAPAKGILACDFLHVNTVGLTRIYVLFLMEIATRRVRVLGATRNPTGYTRYSTRCSTPRASRYFSHRRVRRAKAYAERWVRTVRRECLGRDPIYNTCHLFAVLREYLTHYNGRPPGVHPDPRAAVDHGGYVSVYTVEKYSLHLRETYVPAMSDDWSTQDLTAKYGTPTVRPLALPQRASARGRAGRRHCPRSCTTTKPAGKTWTSVFSVDDANGDLKETYLPAVGQPWTTQDLSAGYGTAPQ